MQGNLAMLFTAGSQKIQTTPRITIHTRLQKCLSKPFQSKQSGAEGGNRTRTPLSEAQDFKSWVRPKLTRIKSPIYQVFSRVRVIPALGDNRRFYAFLEYSFTPDSHKEAGVNHHVNAMRRSI